jgi:hypothetical protein
MKRAGLINRSGNERKMDGSQRGTNQGLEKETRWTEQKIGKLERSRGTLDMGRIRERKEEMVRRKEGRRIGQRGRTGGGR